MLPDTEIAWLAGIFDGEGGARIYRSNQRGKGGALNYFAQVQAVSNTDPAILERVRRDLDAIGIRGKHHSRRDTGNSRQPGSKLWWKACGDIRICGYESVAKYLSIIIQFTTGTKRQQAEHVLEFVKIRLSRGGRNWGKGKPPEYLDLDEAMYQSQPIGRGHAPTIN